MNIYTSRKKLTSNIYYAIDIVIKLFEVQLKNRHIALQFTKVVKVLAELSADGWYPVDILSNSDNNKQNVIKNATIEIQCSRLDGSGISKWVVIDKQGNVIFFGELNGK